MKPVKIKTVYVVVMNGNDIAICDSIDDAEKFIEFYKSSSIIDCKFKIREQALLKMENA